MHAGMVEEKNVKASINPIHPLQRVPESLSALAQETTLVGLAVRPTEQKHGDQRRQHGGNVDGHDSHEAGHIVGRVLLPEHHARVDAPDAAATNQNGRRDGTPGVPDDVVGLPRHGRDDEPVGAGHAQEGADVSRRRVAEEAGHAEADDADGALEHDKGAAHPRLVGEPGDGHGLDDGEERGRRAEDEGHAHGVAEAAAEDDGQEEEERVDADGSGHVHAVLQVVSIIIHPRESSNQGLCVQRECPGLPVSGRLEHGGHGDGLVVLGSAAVRRQPGLDKGLFLRRQERVLLGVGKVDNDEPRDDADQCGQGALDNEDPPPALPGVVVGDLDDAVGEDVGKRRQRGGREEEALPGLNNLLW